MRINTVSQKIIAALLYLAIVVAASSIEMACDANPGANGDAPSSTVAARNTAAAQGTPDNWFVGKWYGKTTGVSLTIKGPFLPGDGNAVLTYFDENRNCSTRGHYLKSDDSRQIFSLLSQNGGKFCDKLSRLTVWKTGENALSYTVTSGKETIIDKGQLSRSGN